MMGKFFTALIALLLSLASVAMAGLTIVRKDSERVKDVLFKSSPFAVRRLQTDDIEAICSSEFISCAADFNNLYTGDCGGLADRDETAWCGDVCCGASSSDCCVVNTGAAIGASIGTIAIIVLIVFASCYCCKCCACYNRLHGIDDTIPQAHATATPAPQATIVQVTETTAAMPTEKVVTE